VLLLRQREQSEIGEMAGAVPGIVDRCWAGGPAVALALKLA
jgi:hypothetical protein